jgi:hypothetical protein
MSPTNWEQIDELLSDEIGFLGPRWEEKIREGLLENSRPGPATAFGKCGNAGRGWLREEFTTYVDNHL